MAKLQLLFDGGSDQLLKLINSVAKGSPSVTEEQRQSLADECVGYYNEAKAVELVQKILEHVDALFVMDPDETEACFLSLFSVVEKAAPEAQPELLTAILEALRTRQSDGILVLRLLGDMINLLPEDEVATRVQVLYAALDLSAGNVQLLTMLEPTVKVFSNAPAAESFRAEVLRKTAAAASTTPGKQVLQKECLQALLGAVGADTAAVEAETVQLLLLSIADPVWTQKNQPALLDAPSVQALRTNAMHGWLVELLETLLRKTLDDFETFQKSHGAQITEAGLDVEALTKSARLLTICALANEKDLLSYGDVAQVLKVPEAEVELWVVNAISAGLLEARLDQLERTVSIQSVSFRHFGREQWLILQERLNEWKTSVAAVMEKLQAAKASE